MRYGLHDVLARGALSTRRVIDYGVQIAHGLAAAHSKNIAHRDLKPDNIFITREGRVKILDFGLAKTVLKPAGRGHDGGMATMTAAAAATDAGTVLGTAGYMSPEQVRGAEVDCRTDIFSFGAVLYEMLTGKRAFKRDTAADTMVAILTEDPPELLESGRQIPPALDRIVSHCLEKAPEQRFQSARDLAFDLESVSSLTGSATIATVKAKRRRNWWYVAAGAGLMALLMAVGWTAFTARRPPTGSQFHQVTYRQGAIGNARFTSDGQNIIYTATWEESQPELYTVAANGVGGHPLGISNARLLAVSKHGELAVALAPRDVTLLLSPGTLARTTDVSGAPKPEIEDIQAADFTPDGSELAIVRYVPAEQTCQVEYPIGKVLFRAEAIDHLRFSPDGRYLAFVAHDNANDDRGTAVILRKTGDKLVASPIYSSVQGLAWSPSGNEVWTTSPLETGVIHALDLSGKTRQPLAVPGRLRLQDIGANGQLLVQQGIARRGMVITHGESPRDLSWLDFGYLRYISDDGKTILFEEEGGGGSQYYTVFVRDIDGSAAIPIGEGYALTLSRDKRWALADKLVGKGEIWLLPVGPGVARRISPTNLETRNAGSFFSDGRRVVYVASEAGRPPRTWMQDLAGGDPRPITEEGTLGFRVSPDDKWLVARHKDRTAVLISTDTGKTEKVLGIKPDEIVRGWTSDGQLYVASQGNNGRASIHIDKVNPQTGARTGWRDLSTPTINGVFAEPPVISSDGTTYGFDYRMRLSDLYTVNGVR